MSLYNDASLVMIPSAYKDGKLYSIKPTDGSGDFTFSRGSNLAATRVDENGLIEKGRENLLLQSNQFDTTWTTTSASITGSQADKDGGTSAWKLVGNTTTGSHYIVQSTSLGAGVYVFSLYAKASGHNYVQLASAQSVTQYANFDLSDGSVGNSGSTFIDAKTEDLGNGWYRLSVVNTTWSPVGFYVLLVSSKTAGWLESWAMPNATDGIYIQDAQLEQGLVATDYIETTTTTAQAGILEDMPRLDYSGGASCPALLLEPQRTNLVPHSEYFSSGSGWTNQNIDYPTSNISTSPDGLNNASLLSGGTTSGVAFRYIFRSITSSTTNTLSFFAKKKTGSGNIWLLGKNNITFAYYNLTNGTADSATSGMTIGIEDYGDGWYRCYFTQDYTSSSVYSIGIGVCVESGTPNYDASINPLQEVYIYGAQLEQGSYATSYIPTYGASVTRSGDSCDDAGNNTIIKTQKGTLFVEIEALANDGTNRMISLTNGTSTTTNATLYFRPTDNRIRFIYEINSVQQASIIYDLPNVLQMNKFAAVYEQDRFVLFVNGSKVGEVTSGDVATEGYFTEVAFDRASQLPFYGKAKQLAYFPTALTDSEAIALTTI